MKPSDLLALLSDLYRDKLALKVRHEAGARRVRDYAANNVYQYVLDREEDHVAWIAAAIRNLGGSAPEVPPEIPTPAVEADVIHDEIRLEQEFLDRWAPRLESVDHARHRKMLGVLMNETREHKRFFEQAGAGRTDMIGHRVTPVAAGRVMSARWTGD